MNQNPVAYKTMKVQPARGNRNQTLSDVHDLRGGFSSGPRTGRIGRSLERSPAARLMRCLPIFAGAGLALLLCGCVVNNDAATQPSAAADPTIRQSQDKAMGDPMSYSPSFDNVDISGGNINELKTKSMNRDVNDVLNP
jgi:hypothetical protein